ncbi:MAG: peptidase and in kexin sedolisin, partial [Solirubrobacterales bacterium]|nr:peptidase and in kexin sedolisin [Solirubrobacterales bacterium]
MRGRRAAASGLLALSIGGPAAATARASDPLREQQWSLDAIRAPAPGAVPGLAAVRVAVLDTGVDTEHEDLAGVVAPELAGWPRQDVNGHGTGVAGIIAARAGNGVGMEGAAAGVTLLSLRVLDAAKQGSTVQLGDAIDAAVAAGARVVNLSLTPDAALARTVAAEDPAVLAMQRAVAAGVVLVGAAGNDGLPVCGQPLGVDGILCVGAVDRARELTDYSNYGTRLDVVAPGGDATDPIATAQMGGGYAG